MIRRADDRRSRPADPGLDRLDAPAAVIDHYRSVDSAPAEYALDRPPRAVNGFLLTFTATSLVALLALTAFVQLENIEDSHDLVLLAGEGDRPALPIRLFVLVFFATFSLSLATDMWRRLAVLAQLCGGVLLIALVADLLALASDRFLGLTVPVALHQVAAAAAGLGLFPLVVLRHAHLPGPVPLPSPPGRIRPTAWIRLLVPLALAVVVAVLLERQFASQVAWLRDAALVGGVGPGVFLVQQMLALLASGIGIAMVARSRRASFAPPIAVLVPAHNEAHGIAETIEALDGAAAAYAGTVRVYVVDNASGDATAEVAQRAIDQCRHLDGAVHPCPTPGKARALNYGLERIREPYVARVDADVSLGENCFDLAMRHFHDPEVGVVGGIPLPAHLETFIDRVRLVEVLIRHGFFQIARVGYDGVVGEPGMFCVFRRDALDRAGPITEGMNGEDTDICMRLTSLGYRCVVDPRARYFSETPRSWSHLREQRTRWFRSTYHVASHNRAALFRTTSMPGAVVLPFALLNAARRAMLTPVLLFVLLVIVVFPHTFTGLRWQPLAAMLVGIPAVVGAAVCLLQGRPRAVLYVPEYLLFRLIRSYYTLGAVLSLRFLPLGPPRWARGRGGGSREATAR